VGTSDHGNIHNIFPSEAASESRLGAELFGGTSMVQGSQKVENRMSQNGGKIAEKAKANGNSLDIGYSPNSQGYSRTFMKNGLNSVRLISTSGRGLFRTDLYDARERHFGVFVKNMSTLTWAQNWARIEEKVRVKQMDLARLAENSDGTTDPKVLRLQRQLATNLDFRFLAVRIVTTNQGGKTPGIDNMLISNENEKLAMVELLKEIVLNPESYKSKPVKRVYIPKASGKMGALGIPTITDRCLQALINLVLEPLVEINSDRHSYGFRKFRSAKMALGAVRVNLRSDPQMYDKYVLDADIKGFFDNISHTWLIENIPLERTLKPILFSWLKAGSIHQDKYEESVTGTPQGGIISPTLANFTLNGLEPTIMKAVKEQYSVGPCFARGIYVGQVVNNDGKKVVKHLSPQVICVRFADDFIVTARSKRMITSAIKPCVAKFLAERGLTLSSEKTKILSVRKSDKINFLGYTFQYQERFSPKYKRFRDRAGREGIACYPQKEKVTKFLSKLKAIFKTSYNLTAYSLIAKLNPIIRGWAAYFNLSQSYDIRNIINYALYRYIWIWATHKHPRWGRRAIARQYFLKTTSRGPGGNSLGYNSSVAGRIKKWTFRGKTLNNSIFNQFTGGKTIELIDPTTVVGTLSAKKYRIPSALETVHAYHPDYRKLIEFNKKMSLEALKEIKTLKSKLLIRQKGRCGICKESLLKLENEFTFDGSMHIHHIKRRVDGGSKNNMGNLMLAHAQCHMTHHAKYSGAEQGRK